MFSPPPPDDFISRRDASNYARQIEMEEDEVGLTPVQELEQLLAMLVHKRRRWVREAMLHPSVFMGRATDLTGLQPLIRAVKEALEDERAAGDRSYPGAAFAVSAVTDC